jgi:transposase
MDLRDRVVSACDAGALTREEIAEEYGVSARWIRKLLKRRLETGSYDSKGHGGGRSAVFGATALKVLDQLVRQQSDATLAELRDRSGVECSLVTIHNTLKRLGYRRKKRPSGRLSKTVRT